MGRWRETEGRLRVRSTGARKQRGGDECARLDGYSRCEQEVATLSHLELSRVEAAFGPNSWHILRQREKKSISGTQYARCLLRCCISGLTA